MKSIGISSQLSAIETFDGIEPGSILIILIIMRHSHLLRWYFEKQFSSELPPGHDILISINLTNSSNYIKFSYIEASGAVWFFCV